MGIDEEGTLSRLSAFRLVTDGLISQHAGRICGTAGDSVLAAFGSALAAVQCAVEIQKELLIRIATSGKNSAWNFGLELM